MQVRIPDGFGLSVMSRFTLQGHCPRWPGVDVLLGLCKEGARRSAKILLLGGWGTVTTDAARILEAAFPGLTAVGIGDLEIRYEEGKWEEPEDIVSKIRVHAPDILAVALGGGSNDRQERWIADHAPLLPSVRIAIGVGGALDIIALRIPRAPQWLRSLGLEWLWRLTLEPHRLPRIFRAVFLFPVLAIWDKLTTRFHAS